MRYPLVGRGALVRGAASGSNAATALLSGASFYIIGHVVEISDGLGVFY